MLWHQLTDKNQLLEIISQSKKQPHENLAVLLFKHSTRCSISSMALNRLQSKWVDNPKIPTYYLDLLSYREISNEIASLFQVEHASPQVLVIKDGKCIYTASHSEISVSDIMEVIAKQTL